ncbi:helix-turn-helix domain-containing protein [Streptomonospora salina]|uniref:Outer membrane biosynthesis protein TonB n=1 Tax=Streptomonospora salina TaxID=104205 RepID=A0A841E898_9ACTN|nr:helix-turn-helix domain-containing protein [Streptomonospora salina]MBB6000187.1 outer membrane biosynthesis protein TonB [Streptomonospora salina]
MASIAVRTDILTCLHGRTAPATAAEIAEATGRGRSTVTQALRGLETDGRAARTRRNHEPGKRVADLWSLAATGAATETEAEAPTSPDPDNDAPAPAAESPAPPEAPAAADAPDTPKAAAAPAPTAEEVPAPQGAETATSSPKSEAPASASAAPQAAATATTENEAPAPTPAARPAEATDATGAGAQTNKISRTSRLEPGGLRQIVKAVLASEPGEEFSPTEISHLLRGRSVGAIQNALARLAKDGEAELTCEAPRRYSAA